MSKNLIRPDYIFEVSWEICNKIGGIQTVVSSKAALLVEQYSDNYICIGPDVWKETHRNPEFIEDKFLYRSWRKQAAKDGLYFRIGRWNVPGEPMTILVDFTPLFAQKDSIFSDLWAKFQLNSLSGQWDYTEPAMFGYAAAKVIESFYDYHLTSRDNIVAQFHEWMTGSGVLYIRDKVPQVGAVFTTHATTLGRTIAGQGLPLYSELNDINPEARAAEMGIVSKQSLEQISAHSADAFTTVSPQAALECKQLLGKGPDVITPNGFSHNFIPVEGKFGKQRAASRAKLLKVASGLFNQEMPVNSLLLTTTGRYEFKNKGIDLFIDALGKLNKRPIKGQIVAFMLIPASQTGPRPAVLERINKQEFTSPVEGEYSTHNLVEGNLDPILLKLKECGLNNLPEDKVKIVYIPAYLDGDDGVLNLNYYNTLLAMDLSVFPAYYEPWGYTPIESLFCKIPTITTSQTGFGQWIREKFPHDSRTVSVLERNDYNENEVIISLTSVIESYLSDENFGLLTDENQEPDALAHTSMLPMRQRASEIANELTWNKLINNYFVAYDKALEKVHARADLYKSKKLPVKSLETYKPKESKPKWKKILIEINLPKELEDLQRMTRNLWWTWNYEAERLFESINPKLWVKSERNPTKLLTMLGTDDYNQLLRNNNFMSEYRQIVGKFDEYMKKRPSESSPKIAYFSMEYGLHASVKIYSGGLGVLAGDYLKQASDDNVPMIGIGLLYRYGYFTQNLSLAGEQLANYHPHNFTYMSAQPVRNEQGEWLRISIVFPGRTVHAKVWRVDVGRVPLYLLDTDLPENISIDKVITHQLYGGDWENRFKQEFLLGIGGIRLIDALGLNPDIYHLNEGHAAFAGLERLRKFVQDDKLNINEAIEVVRSSGLFTTHTPVPAGHDFFSENMLRTYMPHYADRLGISWEMFMALGKIHPDNPDEQFSMSVLATKLSSEVNGVSKIHGKVSRDMFKDLYPGYFSDELHIGYVTNGVHYGTWCAPEWQELYRETFGQQFLEDVSNPTHWEKIYNVSDSKIWEARNTQRRKLVEYIKARLLSNLSRRQEAPKKVYQTIEALNENALTIGFARRFATYKRAQLLLNDLDRLSRIVNNSDMPVQFLFAGKAHPADKAGQELIKQIVEISKRKDFMGKIIFLEDYEMELGAALVKGVDIWLNTPTRPLEASGTSGQKAVLNGVMNLSVLDGWWAEGYVPEAGWSIMEEKTYDNHVYQDELDAEIIYNIFENEIIPMFYDRNDKGVPVEWTRWIKNNIAKIAPHYTNKRMLDDYFKQYYNKLFRSGESIKADNFKKAKELAVWKSKLIRSWESIEIIDLDVTNTTDNSLMLGDVFKAKLVVDLNELKDSDIGFEVVFLQKNFEGEERETSVFEMTKSSIDNGRFTFTCEVPASNAGIYNYAIRMYPRHESLAHRQDFKLIRWI